MKNTIVTIIILAIIAVLFYFGYQKMINNNDAEQTDNNNVAVEVKEFGDFSDYLKSDLTDEQKGQLRDILAKREQKVVEMKQILAEEYGKDDAERKMEVAYGQVAQMRDEIKNQILPFVDSEKMEQFNAFFDTLGTEIESEYILK
ncbi:hypothetical protein CSB11_00330 [Candidatus Campbellbacteria bacterium]|nr:MAG: hypothetical protein CSB11_00330 [Candidatus Campbellbacteria bacterium]